MKKNITIALSGNPNSGKTTVFNAITGARQHIANYPGVTVEKKYGHVTHQGYEIEVVDLPGTYSLTAYSLEEVVARNFLIDEKPDLVVDIVDASNLDRNLYLAVQFMELGIPLVIALNMIDVAEHRDIIVDHQELSKLLQVPVVPMVARSNKGIQELLNTMVQVAMAGESWHPLVISYGLDIDESLHEIERIIESSKIYDRKYPSRWRALKCLEGDSQILNLLKRDPELGNQIKGICESTLRHIMNTLQEEPEGLIADHRYGFIAGITRKAVKRNIELRLNFSDRVDKVLTNRVVGPLIMIAILYAMYAFTFKASEAPVIWLESFFQLLARGLSSAIPPGIFRSLLVSGVIDGVGGVLGFVPLIMFMFFTIAILEDSGYMARVAYMLDRVLRWFGLHGNSVMSLIISGGISGGCAVPGVMATRTLRDPKERIATLLVLPFMNCGAKLPVFAMLIGAFFSKDKARMMFLLTLLSWGFALIAAKFIRSTILTGPKTPFVMELPPYRLPTLRGLLIHTWERTWQYIKKAGTIILGFSIFLWAIMTFPQPSDEQTKAFDTQRNGLTLAFLDSDEIKGLINNRQEVAELHRLYNSYVKGGKNEAPKLVKDGERNQLYQLAIAAAAWDQGENPASSTNTMVLKAALKYLEYRKGINNIDKQEHQNALKGTIAGWIGLRLETITRPLGFNYRTNIALVGGFAAKEVIISTLGTAYSLGEAEPEGSGFLSERLRRDPGWNPLKAFTLIIFIMLYVPCIVTVIMIRKETSWAWAGFSICFNLVAAYLVSLVIAQTGSLMGLGM